MAEREITFPSRDGLRLHGLIDEEGERGWVVILHPHPLYGGEMHNPVVEALKKAASKASFSTLRFNFRGTGRSEGTFGEGIGERRDLEGALDLLEGLGRKGPVIVAGYSFGAQVASSVAPEDDRVTGLALISPPLSMGDFASLMDYRRPKLIVTGDRDFVCPLEELKAFFSHLPEPKVLKVIEGCDHFYAWGMHALAGRHFEDFLRDFFRSDDL
ncbi:MAG TPA: alpha/beta fold hydrolase [Deltaproteobacteria bacterium]|nr:alpha/beta fold hydrolase [Deltaproteobacteria bacterium]